MGNTVEQMDIESSTKGILSMDKCAKVENWPSTKTTLFS